MQSGLTLNAMFADLSACLSSFQKLDYAITINWVWMMKSCTKVSESAYLNGILKHFQSCLTRSISSAATLSTSPGRTSNSGSRWPGRATSTTTATTTSPSTCPSKKFRTPCRRREIRSASLPQPPGACVWNYNRISQLCASLAVSLGELLYLPEGLDNILKIKPTSLQFKNVIYEFINHAAKEGKPWFCLKRWV